MDAGVLSVCLLGEVRASADGADVELGHLLRGLGGQVDSTVTHDDERAAPYRSLLVGRRVLVVVDNAESAEQLRPLLPGSAGCLALVTSRNWMSALVTRDGATRLALSGLTVDGSLDLLRTVLGPTRVETEPKAACELVAL
jgi:hypothetical protein